MPSQVIPTMAYVCWTFKFLISVIRVDRLVRFWFFRSRRSPDDQISRSSRARAAPSPLPWSSQIGVGFRGGHPRPSQIGVDFTHEGLFGVDLSALPSNGIEFSGLPLRPLASFAVNRFLGFLATGQRLGARSFNCQRSRPQDTLSTSGRIPHSTICSPMCQEENSRLSPYLWKSRKR
jgi:hypothetical protein